VLAEQHFLTVASLLSGLSQPADDTDWFSFSIDPHPRPITVGLLMGSTRTAARRELHRRVRDGTLDILIGTHAVIQQEVEVPHLALGVIDEQHRFGVMQRAALRAKGRQPHLLAMSATPIPRTLALTLYGDLELSTIPELPSGRQPISTLFVSREQRDRAEAFVIAQVEQGRQAFVVCPLIDESEAVQARAATVEFDRLRTTSLAALRLGLLHGRMPLKEKQVVMGAFRQGELDVLVATPVIEVGIDVPNATVMLIEGADRFGLSQLHQLRGRVGRGVHKSYCLLLAEDPSEEARQRLETVVKSNDGFEIAEADLQLRGPGDFFGTRQSGLPTLSMARLSDRDLLADARDEARDLLANDPGILQRGPLAEAVRRYTEPVVEEMG
jgi:ATP-dependent DNA helicase RecG